MLHGQPFVSPMLDFSYLTAHSCPFPPFNRRAALWSQQEWWPCATRELITPASHCFEIFPIYLEETGNLSHLQLHFLTWRGDSSTPFKIGATWKLVRNAESPVLCQAHWTRIHMFNKILGDSSYRSISMHRSFILL